MFVSITPFWLAKLLCLIKWDGPGATKNMVELIDGVFQYMSHFLDQSTACGDGLPWQFHMEVKSDPNYLHTFDSCSTFLPLFLEWKCHVSWNGWLGILIHKMIWEIKFILGLHVARCQNDWCFVRWTTHIQLPSLLRYMYMSGIWCGFKNNYQKGMSPIGRI